MFTRQHRAAVSLVVALTLAPTMGPRSSWFARSAHAELTADVKAKQAYARGAELYKERRFAEAAAAFAEGYSNRPHYAFLWNLALAYHALLDRPRAIEYYQRYLAECPATATADRAAAQAAIAEEQRGLAERGQPPAATLAAATVSVPPAKAVPPALAATPAKAAPPTLAANSAKAVPPTPAATPAKAAPPTLAVTPAKAMPPTLAVASTASAIPTESDAALSHATEEPARSGERKIWRKWWFWTATGAALSAVGIGLGVGLAPGSTAPYREVTWR